MTNRTGRLTLAAFAAVIVLGITNRVQADDCRRVDTTQSIIIQAPPAATGQAYAQSPPTPAQAPPAATTTQSEQKIVLELKVRQEQACYQPLAQNVIRERVIVQNQGHQHQARERVIVQDHRRVERVVVQRNAVANAGSTVVRSTGLARLLGTGGPDIITSGSSVQTRPTGIAGFLGLQGQRVRIN